MSWLGSMSPLGSHAWDRTGDRSAWLWLPVLFLLCGFRLSFGPVALELTGLWLPIAAWLGARHGRTGACIVAVAGLPLLIRVAFSGLLTANDVGLYVAALLVCRLFGQSAYRADCLAAGRLSSPALTILLLVLPVTVSYALNLGPLALGATWQLWTYVMLVLLVIGLGDIALRPVLLLLLVACIAGTALAAFEATPSFAGFRIGYVLTGMSSLVTGAVALWLGRAMRRRLGRTAGGIAFPGATAMAVLALLLFVASGVELRVLDAWWARLYFGDALANAMLLFACGVAWGGRGAAIGLLAWAVATALPLALWLGTSPAAMFQPLAWGGFTLRGPPGLVGTSYALGPGVSIAPLEPLYAVFGWLTARALPALPAPAAAKADLPPPLRYRRIDRFV